MDRRGTSVLLIPLIAALALFYPAKNPTGSGSQATAGSLKPRLAKREFATAKPEEWHGGRQAIQRFFGFSDQAATYSWPIRSQDPRENANLTFLIATVPDPVDSGLPHAYDRYLAAIEAAAQRESYLLSDFELPWEDCHPQNKENGVQTDNQFKIELPGEGTVALSETDEKCSRRFATEPGFLLLSNSREKSHVDLLLIYLIGETPTAGIQKIALASALNELAITSGWLGQDSKLFLGAVWPKPKFLDRRQIDILGPSFTGSAQSLDLELSYWVDSFPELMPTLKARLISGSATGINVPTGNTATTSHDVDFYNIRQRLPGSRFSFFSMENPDNATLPRFMRYIADQHCTSGSVQPVKVALLTDSTPYGNNIKSSKRQVGAVTLAFIPYPLHISQLRAASAKLRRSQSEATPQPQLQNKALPLTESLEDPGTRRDVDTFSPANAVTAERVMANILSTISREGYRYVGVIATDVRDTMFLVREVHEHSPKAVLFTFSSDLLYLHPEINESLRGMLVVSSYPLSNSTQLWTLPSDPTTRLQFPDDATEGTYNAALALLGDEGHLLDYSLPFTPGELDLRPPMWISVVGRDRLWPVRAIDLGNQNYTYAPEAKGLPPLQTEHLWHGLYPEGTLVFMAVFVSFCIVYCVPLLPRSRATEWLDRSWLGVVMSPPISEKYRRNGDLFLLVGCSSLTAFLLVALPALAAPAATLMLRRFEPSSSRFSAIEILAGVIFTIICVLIVILLPLGMVSLFRALKPERETGAIGRFRLSSASWLPIVAGCFIVLTLAIIFLGRWISSLVHDDFRDGLLTSFRFLDLTSGVSPLLPLLLLSFAGFLWATSAFHRLRMLEGLGSNRGFLAFAGIRFRDIHVQEIHLRHLLIQSSWRMRGFAAVTVLLLVSILYLFLLHLVPAFEDCFFYLLIGAAYLFVSFALWLGVLRFGCVWNQTRHMLQHLSWTPMRMAAKRFRANFPTAPKIDLAMDAPSLAPVALSLDMIRTIVRGARRLVEAPIGRGGEFNLEMAVEGAEVEAKGKLEGVTLSRSERAALDLLCSTDMARRIEEGQLALNEAQQLDAKRSVDPSLWRKVLKQQCLAQEALADVTAVVSESLELDWWNETHIAVKNSASSTPAAEVFQLCELFLAGRLQHFLSHVLPQMANMIFTSLAGILLMLFAVSSYPLQPHNQLLYFSWLIILWLVGTALWAFIQINRDPILSMLNGTTPGRITWDRDFVFRILVYGVIPILALLGAQFPETFGQVLSRIMPAESMHL